MKHFDRSWTRIGSPPHGRGKVGAILNAGLADRITPAWAGKRAQERFFVFCHEDHPRMGGEKMGVGCPEYILLGLPPRRRGKVSGRRHKSLVPGITPAWAGKSLFCFTAAVPIQDHPRVGGEKRTVFTERSVLTGSPPRGRGKVLCGLVIAPGVRITPAWAGKSR